MKVPLSLLKQYLNVSLSAKELAAVLTDAGIEVDEIRSQPITFSGVVVAAVLETTQHPSADRLKIATVTDGTEQFQIVCGAPNCRARLRTALARIGAELTEPDGKKWKIKKSRLRDVESWGMLCGADELQLGQSEGIIELSETIPLGTDLACLYQEEILELSLTPNLGHCLSLQGIARELSAHLNLPFHIPAVDVQESGPCSFQVKIEDQELCSHYACREVRGVRVGPSPDWLRSQLEACGVRSVNNVVDVGNWVMLECGQPLHLFDADKIEGKRLLVTTKTSHSDLQTLDHQSRPIPPGTLLICDANKPLAFAGVMGGEGSAVSEATVNVLIEAAHFLPEAVRRASRWLHLKTDASYRFERGVDPLLVLRALDRAAALLKEIGAAQSISAVAQVRIEALDASKILMCRPLRVNALLGTQLSLSEIGQLLQRLQMRVQEEGEQLRVEVPSFRLDIQQEVDLIEEVARVYGYGNIPSVLPHQSFSTLENAPLYEMEQQVRSALLQEGLQEFMTCDLISPEQSALGLMHGMHQDQVVRVLYAHSVEQSQLRTTLLPGLLRVVKYNQDRGVADVCGFEVGRVHFQQEKQYLEPSVAGIVLAGHRMPYHWDPKPQEVDFFDAKGIVENLCSGFNITQCRVEPSHFAQFHPGRQASVWVGDVLLGVVAEVHPKELLHLGIEGRVYFVQLNLNELLLIAPKGRIAKPVSAFPGSQRDWTVTVDNELPVSSLFKAVAQLNSALLEKVILLDLYKSAQMGEDRKNVTLRFFYRHQERTLSFEEVEAEHVRIIEAVLPKPE